MTSLSDEEITKLAAIFEHRQRLLKMTEDEAAEEARLEHRRAVKWYAAKGEKAGSFVWFCDVFGHEPSAVRRAIQEKR